MKYQNALEAAETAHLETKRQNSELISAVHALAGQMQLQNQQFQLFMTKFQSPQTPMPNPYGYVPPPGNPALRSPPQLTQQLPINHHQQLHINTPNTPNTNFSRGSVHVD